MPAQGPPATGFLPPSSGELVGRGALLETLGQLLEQGAAPLLTLWGPSGIGKTRLALELGRRHGAAFAEGGVWFCDLSLAPNAEGLCKAVRRTLGLAAARALPLSGLCARRAVPCSSWTTSAPGLAAPDPRNLAGPRAALPLLVTFAAAPRGERSSLPFRSPTSGSPKRRRCSSPELRSSERGLARWRYKGRPARRGGGWFAA